MTNDRQLSAIADSWLATHESAKRVYS